MNSKLYAAPLEGLTGFVWRKAHSRVFGGVDKYFAPFISPRATEGLTARELRDITQDEDRLVPQLLAGNAEHFLWGLHSLAELGYTEINLNCGCPSGTVVAKGKGSGLLRNPESLDRMLYEIFDDPAVNSADIRISIKTRTGYDSDEDWGRLLEIYSKYPVSELIIHPRQAKQQYRGFADRELFLETLRNVESANLANEARDASNANAASNVNNASSANTLSAAQIIYNGDVIDAGDSAYSYGCGVMAGRGLVANPAMYRMVRGGAAATREELAEFHQLVLEGYREYMPGPKPTLHRMKEFWGYYSERFVIPDRLKKKLMKTGKAGDFEHYSEEILRNCDIR